MSQPALLHPQSTPPHSRPLSTKSSKQALGKLKHAFSRRKRSGSLQSGQDPSDLFDGTSQRSASIGPESFISNGASISEEPRISEDVILDSAEPR
jgi:hypothetical protein